MGPRSDHAWIRLVQSNERFLVLNNRLDQVLSTFHREDPQFPSLVIFVDDQRGTAARSLFPASAARRGYDRGLVSLVADASTLSSECPTIISDTSFCPRIDNGCFWENDTYSLPANYLKLQSREITSRIQEQLLFPFGDCIVFPAGGYKSRASLENNLARLIVILSQLPKWCRHPSIAVVVADTDSVKHDNVSELLEVLGENCDTEIHELFGNPQEQRLSLNKAVSAKRERDRRKGYLPFSSITFGAVWKLAFESFIQGRIDCFNPTVQLRTHISTTIFATQLASITRKISHGGRALLPRYVASIILFNAYPPQMHMCRPIDVFDQIYRPLCLRSIYGQENIEYSDLCEDILEELISLFNIMDLGFESAAELHQAQIKRMLPYWATLKSAVDCYYCLNCSAEHHFECGHAICDWCAKLCGTETMVRPYTFEIDKCPFCEHSASLTVRLKPPTAGVSILSLDGGGVGGIIPLQFLSAIEERLGSFLPVQDLFDQVFGTSSGGLIVLAIFHQRLTVAQASELFTELSSNVFEASSTNGKKLLKLWRLIFHDGCYDSVKMDHLLQQTFTRTRTLLDSSISGTKLAVTASDVNRADTYLFTNYNGIPSVTEGYKVLRSQTPAVEPAVWQAARATSAAPSYFSPISLPFLGSFQDGGLRANNPTKLALWEARRIWDRTPPLDSIISLGTGKITATASGHQPNGLNKGFIPRLVRYIQHSTDGNRVHNEIVQEANSEIRRNYFRYDADLVRAVALDAASEISLLKETAISCKRFHRDLPQTLLRLLTRTFFITFDSTSKLAPGNIAYSARLDCRSNASNVISVLLRNYRSIYFELHGLPIAQITDRSVCDICQRINIRFAGSLLSESQEIEARFRTIHGLNAYLSGCPKPLSWFTQRQDAEAVHGSRMETWCRKCKSARRRSYTKGQNGENKRQRC